MKTISTFFFIWVIVIALLSIFNVNFPYRRLFLWVSISILIIVEIFRYSVKNR